MSVLIKCGKMPPLYKTYKVRFAETNGGKIVVGIANEDSTAYMPVGEAVELPPHGRLIDGDVAEVITYTNESGDFADGILYAADWIADQPTIIEADEEQTTVCSATDCEHNVDGVCKKKEEEVSE